MTNKGGRPKKEINQKQFEAMCGIQCTENEICNVLDVTDKTLTRWCKETYGLSFSDVYKKKSATGKMSLRRTQFELAKKNSTMAIWLGKQYLGQRDKFPDEIDKEDVNSAIVNISKLLNNPSKVRTEEDLENE